MNLIAVQSLWLLGRVFKNLVELLNLCVSNVAGALTGVAIFQAMDASEGERT
ncbi:MAG: hypothetical protein ACHP9Y_01350 [Gammaproteobacteria bacterium]